MNAVILCPGPSLARLESLPTSDLAIGVNRACLRFECDVWACIDWTLYSVIDSEIKGDPALITNRKDRARHSARRGTDVETLEQWLPHMPTRWGLFSMTAAMVYAAWSGATSIDIYGCDWHVDAPDYDGIQLKTNRRGEQRFQLERDVFSCTVKAINIEVTRHGLDG